MTGQTWFVEGCDSIWATEISELSELFYGSTEEKAEHSADAGSLACDVSKEAKTISGSFMYFVFLRICDSSHLGLKNCD